MLTAALVVVLSYLIGSIPAGYIAGRLAGIDIRTVGSGNIGATNVLRALGKKYGYPVFLFDFFKGFVAVKMSIFLAGQAGLTNSGELYAILGGVSSVIGHSYPIWLRFKGGKGVATSLGVLFGLMPLVGLIAVAVWGLTFATTRFVSVASMAAALVLPIATAVLLHFNWLSGATLFYFALCLAALVIWRHRTNLSRLMRGTEPRFNRK